jgi:hypothetical protein
MTILVDKIMSESKSDPPHFNQYVRTSKFRLASGSSKKPHPLFSDIFLWLLMAICKKVDVEVATEHRPRYSVIRSAKCDIIIYNCNLQGFDRKRSRRDPLRKLFLYDPTVEMDTVASNCIH